MKSFFSTLLFLLTLLLAQANPYQVFEENGKAGLKDPNGKVLIPAQYDAIGWSNGTFSVVQYTTGYRINNQWGLITVHNRLVTSADFIELYPTESQLLLAARQNKATLQISRGCLNPSGQTVIPFVYAGIRVVGLRAITYSITADNQLRYGLTDLQHRTLLPATFTYIYPVGNLRFAVRNQKGKTGLFNEHGKPLTDFVFDSIAAFQSAKAIFYQNGRQGLMNRNGEILIPGRYKAINYTDNQWTGLLPDTWLMLTPLREIVYQTDADSLVALANGHIAVVRSNTIEFLDNHLKPLDTWVPATGIEQLVAADMMIIRAGNHLGVVRYPDGSTVLPPVFQHIAPAHGFWVTAMAVSGKLQWYLYNLNGQRISGPYDYLEPFSNEFFRAIKNRYEGLLNHSGRAVLPCVYDRILKEKDGLVVVQFRKLYGIMNTNDEWVVPPQPNPLTPLGPNTYLEQEGTLTWLRNISGKALYFTTNPIRQQGEYLIEETSSGGRWTINMEGRIVDRELPAIQQAEWTGPSSEGFRPVRRNGRYGFINDAGLLMIPNRYEDATPFSEGRAGIKIRNKWGFIDRNDRIAVQPVYDKVLPFVGNTAKVCLKNKWGLIDRDGKILVPIRYDSLSVLPSGRVLVGLEGFYGLFNMNGDILLHPRFEEINDLNNGLIIVKQFGKSGVVDERGIPLIPVNYNYLIYHEATRNFIGCLKGSWEKL